jgi:hypothetical protein
LDQTGEKYQVTIKGPGLTVEREVGESKAFEILGIVMAGSAQTPARDIPARESTTAARRPVEEATAQKSSNRKQSLREYLDEVEAKRNPDKILAIAKYVADDTGNDRFASDDVKARFPDAAERVPGNYGRDFRWVVRNGWIASAGSGTDEFYVTGKGDKALAEKFSIDVRRTTGVSKGRQGGRRKKTTQKAKN